MAKIPTLKRVAGKKQMRVGNVWVGGLLPNNVHSISIGSDLWRDVADSLRLLNYTIKKKTS